MNLTREQGALDGTDTVPAAQDHRRRRATAVAGAAFVVLSAVGLGAGSPLPATTRSPAQAVADLAAHHQAELITIAMLSLANGALLVFFAHLRVLSQGRSTSPWPTLGLSSAALLCAIGAATSAAPAALAYYGTAAVAPSATGLILRTYYAGNALSAMPAALATASVALSARGYLPRWLRYASAVAALVELSATLSLFGSGPTAPEGALGTGLLFGTLTAWVLVPSLSLATKQSTITSTVALTSAET